MDNTYQYYVTVIVPIYNAEKYLEDCLDSLVMQTIDKTKIEVLLINDGSSDRSLQICQRYADSYSFFKVYTKKNEGVSATRNKGIRNAKGKYIMYLDADDALTENTVQSVFHFFEKHYSEVDLVTYPERTYLSNGDMRALHIRYKTLNKSGIYNLKDKIYLFQVRLNIAVKNLFAANILFDENMGYHEDQKYCCEVLIDKMKLGYVDDCEYQYKLHDGNITGENTNPIQLFEPTMKYWEDLFDRFSDKVPEYFQALYLHDLSWKLTQNCLLPYQYHGEEWKRSTKRLWKLLKRVDDNIILSSPSVDNFHRFFFLERKAVGITPFFSKNRISLLLNGKVIYSRNKFELIFNRCREENGKFFVQCTLKSQIYNFCEKPRIFVKENNEVLKEMELFFSSMSYYRSKTITNHFWGFYYECELSNVNKFEFLVETDGLQYETTYYLMPSCAFIINKSIVRNDYIITLSSNKFMINKSSGEAYEKVVSGNNNTVLSLDKEAYKLRVLSEKYVGKRIWLYYDCKGVEYDNGYLQFMHDSKVEDGIERYYILNNPMSESRHLFQEDQLNKVVMFGTELHKELFIRAEKIITAYAEEVNLYPFPLVKKSLYRDIMNAEIVYLQHGILHASLPWKYTPEKIEVDKVVASSMFEVENFHNKYCFRKEDILPYGMPRFEMLDKKAVPKNRILFAPTWRMYLIGQCIDTVWQLTEDKFIQSKYYLTIQEFLSSKELLNLLDKYDLFLDFKIHPIFKPYLKYFTIVSNRIVVTDHTVRDEDYCLFITDFSSYTFNFVYLERPIIYFVPDMLEFEAGLNQYRRLDLPFDKAFGELAQTVPEVINSISKVVRNDFTIQEEFKDRMEKFFLPINECSKKIYSHI